MSANIRSYSLCVKFYGLKKHPEKTSSSIFYIEKTAVIKIDK